MSRFVSGSRFICGLLLAASTVAAAETKKPVKSVPAFFAPDLVDVGQPLQLSVSKASPDVKSWAIQWGDGSEETLDKTLPILTHTYAKSGPYSVSVAALLTDGTRVPAIVSYRELIAEDRPAFAVTTSSPVTAKSPWGDETLTFGNTTCNVLSFLPVTDRFSFDFWWKPTDLKKRQEIFTSTKSGSADFFLQQGKLHFQPAQGAIFVQALPGKFALNKWHHFAITYARAPLLPYANRARFYLDGILLGDQHLDIYDTGAVNGGKPVVGSAPDGSNPLRGEVADMEAYASDLPPLRILQHARILTEPGKQTVFAATPVVKPILIDSPNITQTVSVPLDPAPDADNGPIFRKALQEATPGTRLELIEKTTGKTGGTYHFRSLDDHDSAVFSITGRRDLDINGLGATLVFSTNTRHFYLRDCQRITLRNFAIDLDQTQYRVGVYARILDLDPATGDIHFQFVNGRDFTPDRTVPPEISLSRWRPLDPKNLRVIDGPSFKTSETLQDKPKRDPNDASLLIARVKREMIPTLDAYRRGANFFLVSNAAGSNKCVEISHSLQVTFDSLSFYASLGTVFFANNVNHVHVVDCKIGLPPGLTAADRPLASAGDGFRFRESQGDLLFERNEIALTDGDPISIKDNIWSGVHELDQFTIAMPHVRKGDEIELFREDFTPFNFRADVVAVNNEAARLDQSLPADLPPIFLAMGHSQHSQNWILSRNDLHDNHGSLQLCTPNGLIRNNRIESSSLHLGASTTAYDNAGIASSVTVADNLLIDTPADTAVWNLDTKYPVFQDISFAANSFMGDGLKVTNAGSPMITGNYFEPRPDGKPALSLWRTQSPSITNNFQLAMQPSDFIPTTTESENVFQQNNTMLAPKP